MVIKKAKKNLILLAFFIIQTVSYIEDCVKISHRIIAMISRLSELTINKLYNLIKSNLI